MLPQAGRKTDSRVLAAMTAEQITAMLHHAATRQRSSEFAPLQRASVAPTGQYTSTQTSEGRRANTKAMQEGQESSQRSGTAEAQSPEAHRTNAKSTRESTSVFQEYGNVPLQDAGEGNEGAGLEWEDRFLSALVRGCPSLGVWKEVFLPRLGEFGVPSRLVSM